MALYVNKNFTVYWQTNKEQFSLLHELKKKIKNKRTNNIQTFHYRKCSVRSIENDQFKMFKKKKKIRKLL